MSAQPPTTPRIEDLRARLRLDPKARHFYPLAEELRKLGQLEEAEKILREGLTHHASYLSAWVSLGRILAEKGSHREAVEALNKALVLDPGNVVCAKLLASSYLALGEKVEALKKLKLVMAVMPGDDEIEAQIASLEQETSDVASRPAGFAPPAPAAAPQEQIEPLQAEPPSPSLDVLPGAQQAPPAPQVMEPSAPAAEPTPREAAGPAAEEDREAPREELPPEGGARDLDAYSGTSAAQAVPPWEAAPETSPFLREPGEEKSSAQTVPLEADVLPEEIFAPAAPVDRADLAPEPEAAQEMSFDSGSYAPPREAIQDQLPETTPLIGTEEPADVFSTEPEPAPPQEPWTAEAEEPLPEPAAIADDRTTTLTMGALYEKQGHDDAAREIYERVLEKDPANTDVRERLSALVPAASSPERERRQAAASRLERWLDKVGRRGL